LRRSGVTKRNKPVEKIPAEDFKNLILQVKADKGLTWAEMADLAGRTVGTMVSYAHGRKVWVSQRVADDILQRLAGANLPPTRLQQVKYTQLRRKDQSEQRAETLQTRKLDERKGAIAELRKSLGTLRLDEG